MVTPFIGIVYSFREVDESDVYLYWIVSLFAHVHVK